MSNNEAVYVDLELRDNLIPQLREVQAFANKVGKEVTDVKRKSLQEMRETQRHAVRIMSGVRQLFYAFGGALDPFWQAVFNIVGSSIEMLYALATAEGSTILGIPAAAVHGGIALAIEAVTLPHILAGIENAQAAANRAIAAVDAFALFGGY